LVTGLGVKNGGANAELDFTLRFVPAAGGANKTFERKSRPSGVTPPRWLAEMMNP